MLVLETERLALYQFTTDDAAFIRELLNTPGWLRFIGNRNIQTLEDARKYIENVLLPSYQQFGFGFYQVRLQADDTAIGMCGLVKRPTLPAADIGYALLPAYTGRGYAAEAATAVAHYAFNTLGFPQLLAITEQENVRSMHLLGKIGLRFERPIRLADMDLLLYSSTSPE
jgi:RimJ/RimL family protein N-acetyltransferase